jgi:predicted CXXCH cytochrome family protein
MYHGRVWAITIGRQVALTELLAIAAFAATTNRCLPCHAEQVEAFSRSAMAHSIAEPPVLPKATMHPPGSPVQIDIEYKNGHMIHRESANGVVGAYAIQFAVGSGIVGQSFLADVGGHLMQSPASYYTARGQWDLTPGYEGNHMPGFTQSVTRDCLFCHAGSAQSLSEHRFVPASVETITCERCHGPSKQHLRQPSAANIVNPAKLPVRERDSVCEQCHLKGAAAVLQPGKQWSDFQPGQKMEAVAMHYVEATPNASIVAVSHAEQLSLSRCVRASAGRLWCGTCHNPHGAKAADRTSEIRQVCTACHPATTLAANHSSPEQADCVACHMPRRPTADVAHAAVTDHRIVKRPEKTPGEGAGSQIVAWKLDDSPSAARNAALAWFAYAQKSKSPPVIKEAYRRLVALPPSRDAAVEAATGYLLLAFGQPKLSTPDFLSATHDEPTNPEYWLDLGVSQDAAGNTTAAIEAIQHAISLDQYDYRPYLAAAKIYRRLQVPDQARRMIERYLRLDPQSLTMRLAE